LDIATAIEERKELDVLSRGGATAATRPFADGSWEFGSFDRDAAMSLLRFDVSLVSSDVPAVQEFVSILQLKLESQFLQAQQSEYSEAELRARAFDKFNQRLRCKGAGPVLREAGFSGDSETIHAVRALCPQLRLDHANLQGSQGESALHMAAAAGQLEAMRLLLSLRCNANAQDAQGETPLHYASYTGHSAAVQLLLASGASRHDESFDMEAPIDIARLCPAFFLGVDTQGAIDALIGQDSNAPVI